MAIYGDAPNIFSGMIDEDGTIYEATSGRKRNIVGIDDQRHSELLKQISDMQGVIDNYYEKLVELGAITPPKTPEQIAQEQAAQQAEINMKLLEAINNLQIEIGTLKSGGVVNERYVGDADVVSGNAEQQNSVILRQEPARRTGSTRGRKAYASGNIKQPDTGTGSGLVAE